MQLLVGLCGRRIVSNGRRSYFGQLPIGRLASPRQNPALNERRGTMVKVTLNPSYPGASSSEGGQTPLRGCVRRNASKVWAA